MGGERAGNELLSRRVPFATEDGEFAEVAARAVRLESRTNLLFSFEKMALRDAVKPPEGARSFAEGLYEFIYGTGDAERKFQRWCDTVGALPRKQTRVLTWPLVTVFGFIALPDTHIFLKPNVTRAAARAYGSTSNPITPFGTPTPVFYSLPVSSTRSSTTCSPRHDDSNRSWVQGSDEY